jgi:lipopolysaccharide export system protein LptC
MAGGKTIPDAIADPLTKLPPAKPAIDWTARYRATTLDVQRYSRFVGVMKRALPMAAAALLVAVVAYSLQPRLQNSKKLTLTMQKIGILNNDLMMIKPKLTGADGEGNPYVVTAEEAVQDAHDAKRAQLRHVEADMTLKNGEWLNLTATRGWLDESKQKLRLQGAIDIYTDKGYEAHTTLANVDMHSGVVWGNAPVNGQGPFGTFRADRFRIDRDAAAKHGKSPDAKKDKTNIYLYGHVQMTIYKGRTTHP